MVWAGGGAAGRSQQRRTPWDSGWPRGGETRKGEGHLGDGVTRTGDPEEQQQLGAGLPRGSPAPPPLLVWTHLLPAPQLVPRAPLPSLCPPETVAESCPNPTSNPRCEPPLTGTSPPSCSQREKPCFLSAPELMGGNNQHGPKCQQTLRPRYRGQAVVKRWVRRESRKEVSCLVPHPAGAHGLRSSLQSAAYELWSSIGCFTLLRCGAS